MKNFHQFLLARIASFAAAFLLLVGLYDLWLADESLSTGSTGLYLVTIGAILAIASIAAMLIEGVRASAERIRAIEAAQRVAIGETVTAHDDDDLHTSIAEISDRLERFRGAIESVISGRGPEDLAAFGESDALGALIGRIKDTNRSMAEVRAERDRLVEYLDLLTNKLCTASRGDLSPFLPTGPIAFDNSAAFNSFVDEIRRVFRQVETVSEQAKANTGSAIGAAEQASRSSAIQSSQSARAMSAAAKIASRIREIDENANDASRLGDDFMKQVRAGKRSSQDMVGAMHFVRRKAQETSKRVKRLGERSQEIGQIIALIDDLSDKTSLLALNATLQASASGEAASAFVTMADEVDRLAERSRKLTSQAAALTNAMNTEAKEAVASMDETVREVVIGTALAEKAGKELLEVDSASQPLAEILSSFSECVRDQALSSDELSAALLSISEAAGMIETVTKAAAESNRATLNLSEELSDSVARFDLRDEKRPVPQIPMVTELRVN